MIQNRRDLGKIRTRDGKMIRPGMLIRSAHLFQAEENELDGISAVIDLRTTEERSQAPDRTYGADYYPMPVFDGSIPGVSHEQGSEIPDVPDMSVLYAQMMSSCADAFREILLRIMEHDFSSGAILWHCTEGKDRCGMTTALLLELLGVERTIIMEDYLKTNIASIPKAVRIRERARQKGEEFAEKIYQLYIADQRYLESAWEAMGDRFFTEKLNIPEKTLLRFQSAVLEST